MPQQSYTPYPTKRQSQTNQEALRLLGEAVRSEISRTMPEISADIGQLDDTQLGTLMLENNYDAFAPILGEISKVADAQVGLQTPDLSQLPSGQQFTTNPDLAANRLQEASRALRGGQISALGMEPALLQGAVGAQGPRVVKLSELEDAQPYGFGEQLGLAARGGMQAGARLLRDLEDEGLGKSITSRAAPLILSPAEMEQAERAGMDMGIPETPAERAFSTLGTNLASGATLGLGFQDRLLDPRFNDPQMAGLGMAGQLVGSLPAVLASAGAGSLLGAGARAASPALRARMATMPAYMQRAVPMAAGVGSSNALQEVGSQRLMQKAGMREPDMLRDAAGVVLQGVLGGAAALLPAGFGLGARSLPTRVAAGAATGAGLGAGIGLLQTGIMQETGTPITNPEAMRALRMQTIIGAVMGGLARPKPFRAPDPSAYLDPTQEAYSPQMAEQIRAKIAGLQSGAEAEGKPLTWSEFMNRWDETGLPTEVLDAAGVKQIILDTPAKQPVDIDAINTQIARTMAQLPEAQGTTITRGSGDVLFVPNDPVDAAKRPFLYKLQAMALGASEIELRGQNQKVTRTAVPSNVRWQLEHHAAVQGTPGMLQTVALQVNKKFQAAAHEAVRIVTSLAQPLLKREDFLANIDSITSPMFKRWAGMRTMLLGSARVSPDMVKQRIGPYWVGADVQLAIPNSEFMDVGFIPKPWFQERLNILRRQQNKLSPAERIELSHLLTLNDQSIQFLRPWHARMYDAAILGEGGKGVWIVAPLSGKPQRVPQVEVGLPRAEKEGLIASLRRIYDTNQTPENLKRLQSELKRVYGARKLKTQLVDEDEWRFHTYSRTVMAAIERSLKVADDQAATRIVLPYDEANRVAVQRLFAEMGFGKITEEHIRPVPSGAGVPDGDYVVLPITSEMRSSIRRAVLKDFNLPSAQSTLAGGAAALALGLADGELQEDDGALLLGGFMLPKYGGARSARWFTPVAKSMIRGAAAGGAVGYAVSDEDSNFQGLLTGALIGATLGSSYRAFKMRPDALWNKHQSLRNAYPDVAATLQPNTMRSDRWDTYTRLAHENITSWGKRILSDLQRIGKEFTGKAANRRVSFTNFGNLRALGPVGSKAILRFHQYLRKQADSGELMHRAAEKVLSFIETPAELRLFDDIWQTRMRLERAYRQREIGEPIVVEQPEPRIQSQREAEGLAVHGEVLPQDLQNYYDSLLSLLDDSPRVQAAVDKFDQLLGDLQAALAQAREIHPDDIGKGTMAPMYRLFAENPDMLSEIPVAGPYSAMVQENPQMLAGGRGPTLHSFVEVMPRYITAVQIRLARNELIEQLARDYDPAKIAQTWGQKVADELDYVPWHQLHTHIEAQPELRAGLRDTVPLPRAVADELMWHFNGLEDMVKNQPQLLRSINRATSSLKSWIINGVYPIFLMNNLFGDTVTAASTSSPRDLLSLFKRDLVDTWKYQMGKNLEPETRALLEAADRESLGLGGASAEMSTRLYGDPRIYHVRITPGEKPAVRLLKGAELPFVMLGKGMRQVREFQEGLNRRATFLQEMRGKNLPEGLSKEDRVSWAAALADERIVSYSNTSPAFRAWMKNFLFPFSTWFLKQAKSYTPGFADALTGSKKVHNHKAALRLTYAITGAMALALYNDFFHSDAEESIQGQWQSTTPHMWLPGPTPDTRTLLVFPNPGTAVGEMAGLGGLAERLVDVASGKTTLMKQFNYLDPDSVARRQMHEMWFGLVNPMLTIPTSIALQKDLRTGRAISDPRKGPWGKVADNLKFVATALPPMSIYARSTRDGSTPDETMLALAKRMSGSLLSVQNIPQNKFRQFQRNFLRGIREGMDRLAKERYEAEQRTGSPLTFAPKGSGGWQVWPAQDLFNNLGPAGIRALYHTLARDSKMGRELGLKDYNEVQSFLGGLSSIARQFAGEAGGNVAGPDGLSWDLVSREIQVMQQNPAGAAMPDIREAIQAPTRTLFGGGGR